MQMEHGVVRYVKMQAGVYTWNQFCWFYCQNPLLANSATPLVRQYYMAMRNIQIVINWIL